MSEIIFGFVIIALLLSFILYVRESNNDKSKLLNALIAKSSEQFRDLNLADKVAPIKPRSQEQSQVIDESSLNQEDWEAAISAQLQKDKEEE